MGEGLQLSDNQLLDLLPFYIYNNQLLPKLCHEQRVEYLIHYACFISCLFSESQNCVFFLVVVQMLYLDTDLDTSKNFWILFSYFSGKIWIP